MKFAKIFFITLIFLSMNLGYAEDGMKDKFQNIQMNINRQNYIIFEDDALIICDRETDKYLVEITPEIDLYIESQRLSLNKDQMRLLKEYYEAQQTLFSKRNSIGAKGVHIGIESAKLAVTAVGGAVDLALSGFDEDVEAEFEQEIEMHAKRIERKADAIEEDSYVFEHQIEEVNRINRRISPKIEELSEIDLSVDEDRFGIDRY